MKKSILEILETDTEASHKLKLLTEYVGWKLLVEILTKNEVEPLKEKLENGEYETIEARNRDKDKLENWKKVLTAPDFYRKALSSDEDGGKPNLDPYATDIEEAKRVAAHAP